MAFKAGWGKRVKLTADNTDIDSALVDFPALLVLGTSVGRNSEDLSFVFDEVGTAFRKIAITQADGTTECYGEVESWGSTAEKAYVHFKAPTLMAGTDTDHYLYFDSTHADNNDFIGGLAGGTAQNVWDGSYSMVQHMVDFTTGSILDSTSNDNDGTKGAPNEPIEDAGKIALCQEYDGANDIINCGSDPSIDDLASADFTLSAWINPDGLGEGNTGRVAAKRQAAASGGWLFFVDAVASLGAQTIRVTGPVDAHVRGADNQITLNAWNYVTLTYTVATKTLDIYVSGVEIAYDTDIAGANGAGADAAGVLIIGNDVFTTRTFDGHIDEVRISTKLRNGAWIKASYETQRDNLLDWGAEETSGVELAGTIDAISSVSGVIKIKRKLAGIVGAISSVTGILKVKRKLAGTVDAVSGVTGDVKAKRTLAGTIDGVSSVTGELNLAIPLAGTIDGISSVTGDLTVAGPAFGINVASDGQSGGDITKPGVKST